MKESRKDTQQAARKDTIHKLWTALYSAIAILVASVMPFILLYRQNPAAAWNSLRINMVVATVGLIVLLLANTVYLKRGLNLLIRHGKETRNAPPQFNSDEGDRQRSEPVAKSEVNT